MHTSTGGVRDDDIGTAMLSDEIIGEDVFHISSIKQCLIILSIERSIDFCIFNSLRHIFNADYKACFLRNKIGDCARARVKVVDKFITGELGKFTCHLIKFVGLLRISLIKAFRPHLEAQTFHLFVDKISTTIGDDIQISYCIVTLCVIDIK